MNAAGMPAPTLPLRREAMACRHDSRPSGVRMISTCGAPAAAFPSFSSGSASAASSGAGPGRGVLSSTFTGVSSAASTPSAASAADIASSNPAAFSCALTRRRPCRPSRRETLRAEQHADELRGPLGRHVPVTRQQHRGGVQHRPVGHRARVQARRRPRERDRPAARARKARQQALRHLPEDLHVDDLRPPRLARRLRAVQGRPAGPAFRGRLRGLRLVRVRVPFRAFSLVTGLPAALAVLAALPLGLLPGLAGPLFAPIRSFELGVPESVLSIASRRSSSASRSSRRRRCSRSPSSAASAASRPAVSDATCSSFAAMTARNRSTSGCSPGSSDTSRKHAQPELKLQATRRVGMSRPRPREWTRVVALAHRDLVDLREVPPCCYRGQ